MEGKRMAITQISVFLENNAGRLADVTRVLSKAGINLRAISVADTADFGILRLIVDNPAAAEKALSNGGFTTRETSVLAVELADKPGSLADVVDVFGKAGVNIEYLYATLSHAVDRAVVIIKCGKADEAAALVAKHGLTLVDEV
jgi:hypothetical protein